jgi:indolepyruvate ferredoxin oxidoreductase alpha subunit
MKQVVALGDEAVALGAIHAGISGIFGYPGTPSTEIFEYVQKTSGKSGEIHAYWSANEKVGYEEALGMSFAGKRAMVTMKHVGLNVAADPFMNSGITGTGGGLVLAVADDPGMHSSQNEQDSRYFAQFCLIPCFEPSDQQECYEMTREAFDISEKFGLPVMLRIVTRLAHSRANIEVSEPREQNALSVSDNWQQWTLLPGIARVRYKRLTDLQPDLDKWADDTKWNVLDLKGKKGIIACGIAYNYLIENLDDNHDLSILKISAYPFPLEKIRNLVEHCDEVLVLEDGYPFVEKHLEGFFGIPGKHVHGKLTGHLPRTGELTPDLVRAALEFEPNETATDEITDIPARPPALCKGCPHADTYNALTEALKDYPRHSVLSDIGCYTLGALPPYSAIQSCVDMGASISMAAGAAHAGAENVVCVIGDSTFTHSGMTPLIGAAKENVPITVFILDNAIVAMTGFQQSMATGEKMVKLVEGLGVDPEHIVMLTPLPKQHEENVAKIKKAIEYKGLSVVIAQRACVQIRK